MQVDFFVDNEHFLHFSLKIRISPFQIIFYFMRLNRITSQYSPDSGFSRIGQTTVSSAGSMLASIFRKQPMIYWFCAGKIDDLAFASPGKQSDEFFAAVHADFCLFLYDFSTIWAFFFEVGLEDLVDGNIGVLLDILMLEEVVSDRINT